MLKTYYVIGNVCTESYEDAKDYVDIVYRMDDESPTFDYLAYIKPVALLSTKEVETWAN